MNDWNSNGKNDLQDKYIDYKAGNNAYLSLSGHWFCWLVLGFIFLANPVIGIIMILIILFCKSRK